MSPDAPQVSEVNRKLLQAPVELKALRRVSGGTQSEYRLTVSRAAQNIDVSIVRRRRKTMGLYVESNRGPELRVPLNCPWHEIEDFLTAKFDWMLRAQRDVAARQLHPPNDYQQGGSITYLGQRVRLELARSRHNVADFQPGKLLISCQKPDNQELIEKRVHEWYRRQGESLFAESINRLNKAFLDKTEPSGLVIRKMKSRWGSCSSKGEICLNLLLVKEKPPQIDFVIAHELCHLRHFAHNAGFYSLLDRVMPDWRERETALTIGG